MSIFRKTKKKRNYELDIDWRITPEEYLHISFFSVIILYFIAWNSIVAASMLYILAIGGFLILLINLKDTLFNDDSVDLRLTFPFFIGLFFMLFALSPSFQGYVLGAYLASMFVNVAGYFALRHYFPRRFKRW